MVSSSQHTRGEKKGRGKKRWTNKINARGQALLYINRRDPWIGLAFKYPNNNHEKSTKRIWELGLSIAAFAYRIMKNIEEETKPWHFLAVDITREGGACKCKTIEPAKCSSAFPSGSHTILPPWPKMSKQTQLCPQDKNGPKVFNIK